MAKNKKRYEVFILDEDHHENESLESLEPADQKLRTRIEKKQRGGKVVTIIAGFKGQGIEALTKTLKTKCGVGGSGKGGEILLQGDVRLKAIEQLKKLGYKDVK